MECPVLDRQWLPLRLPQEEEDLKPTLWRPFAFLDSDSIEQDYLLERNTSFPSIPSSSFDLIQGEEDNDCAALLKDHTATAAAASPPYLSRTSRTEDLSNRSEKENQSTNKQLSVDIDSRYTDSEDERANECRLVSPRTNTSSKRHRATHVHNLSEKRSKLEDFSANQRRRNRFNEKLKALQLLIPNSQKTDKASILEEAIQYVKQLQLQVQMLSSPNKLNPSHTCVPVGIPCFQMPQMFMNMGINMAHSHSQWNNGFMIVPQRVQGQTILPWANEQNEE